MFRKKVVHVLGAGPAGLLAAHAAERKGHMVNVFTAPNKDGEPAKSELHGCQYLHAYVPDVGLGKAGRGVRYLLEGDAEGYRRKVYGDTWSGSVSPDEYGPEKNHMAWNLRKAYDFLWTRWEHRIKPLALTPDMAERASRTSGVITLCTIPVPALCRRPDMHKFLSKTVWAMGSRHDSHGLDQARMPFRAPDMTVLCNGDKDTGWYRAATVFGQSTIEWPEGRRPPVTGVVLVNKPLRTDCTCLQGRSWFRLGRFGQWRKGVLVHEAYEQALEILR